MKYIKIGVWIFFLSLIYACGLLRFFDISAEVLILFTGIYAYIFEQKKESRIIAIVCALLVCGLGGRGFVFSALATIYFYAICTFVKPSKKPIIKISAISFIYFLVLESLFYFIFCFNDIAMSKALTTIILPSAIYNLLFCIILYFLVKKIFTEKEKYIF